MATRARANARCCLHIFRHAPADDWKATRPRVLHATNGSITLARSVARSPARMLAHPHARSLTHVATTTCKYTATTTC
eukprot:340563-Lingulodinium_polyedra.AAC.1